LQHRNPMKYRVAPVPFEVDVNGRLEGEVLSQQLQDQSDPRLHLRQLRKTLKPERMSFVQNAKRESNEGSRIVEPMSSDMPDISHTQSKTAKAVKAVTASLGKKFANLSLSLKHRYAEGIPADVERLFDSINEDGAEEISEERFVTVMHKYYEGHEEVNFDHEDLVEMFRYLDLDGDGHFNVEELAVSMRLLSEPVYPCEHSRRHRQDMYEAGDVKDLALGAGTASMFIFSNTDREDFGLKGKEAKGRRFCVADVNCSLESTDMPAEPLEEEAVMIESTDMPAEPLEEEAVMKQARLAEDESVPLEDELLDVEGIGSEIPTPRLVPLAFLDEGWGPADLSWIERQMLDEGLHATLGPEDAEEIAAFAPMERQLRSAALSTMEVQLGGVSEEAPSLIPTYTPSFMEAGSGEVADGFEQPALEAWMTGSDMNFAIDRMVGNFTSDRGTVQGVSSAKHSPENSPDCGRGMAIIEPRSLAREGCPPGQDPGDTNVEWG